MSPLCVAAGPRPAEGVAVRVRCRGRARWSASRLDAHASSLFWFLPKPAAVQVVAVRLQIWHGPDLEASPPAHNWLEPVGPIDAIVA